MATAGHFVTMTGVFFFYFMFLDSKMEKKTTAYLHSLVARFNKRANYYSGKLVHLNLLNKSLVNCGDVSVGAGVIIKTFNFFLRLNCLIIIPPII